MKTFALAALAAVSQATVMTEMDFKFMNFITKFAKRYETREEFNLRQEIFARSEERIAAENAKNAGYTVGHNALSDLTDEEYTSMLGLKNIPQEDKSENPAQFYSTANSSPIDWRDKAGVVTPVKDQGQCGSCWTFSTTGAMEGAHQIRSGELLSFSEQQLVDCVKLCFGCNGGNPLTAYRYLETHKAELESVYPYVSGTTKTAGTCAYNEGSATAVDVSSFKSVTADSISQMKAALAQQPLSVLVEADTSVFQRYSSGVLDSTECGTNLDHAVLAVGYGNDSATGLDYWLVKNSWNTTWGDQGYIKIA
jgi:C1A family cysteine protease